MGEGGFHPGGLHVRSVEQWRHCEEMTEGEYVMESLSGLE